MKKKCILLQGAAIAASLLVGSQARMSAQSTYLGQYMMPDPQVWAMFKYGGQTPDLYTGTVRAEIPVYTYKDLDFEIPVSLTYASGGYMPNTTANFTGLGWSLNTGGCITRRVRGEKDESEHGFFKYSRTQHSTGNILDRNGRGEARHDIYGFVQDNKWYETESDIYMFSVCGMSGKFVIGDNGSAIVYDSNVPSGEIAVDISGLGVGSGSQFATSISIRDGKGYTYRFGDPQWTNPADAAGIYTSRRYLLGLSGPGGNDIESDSWPLSSITAPNGRKVTFTYRIDAQGTTMDTVSPMALQQMYSLVVQDNDPSWFLTNLSSYLSGGTLTEYFQQVKTTRRVPLPTEIDIDGSCRIEFGHAPRTAEQGPVISGSRTVLNTPHRLSSIIVKNTHDNTQLCRCTLGHTYTPSSGNRVMLLSSVSIDGLGTYSMTYCNQSDAFPYQGTCAIDHWGYYNGNDSEDPWTILPDVKVDKGTYAEVVESGVRNPSTARSMYGMLKRITYPTGGYTAYEYEGHDYGNLVIRDLSAASRGMPVSVSLGQNRPAGGVRVCKITDNTGNGESKVTLFRYGTGSTSSGTMLSFPRYSQFYERQNDISFQSMSLYSTSIPGYILDNTHVGYSQVEVIHGDGSSTGYSFSDYSDAPDILGGMDYRSLETQIQLLYPSDPGVFFHTLQSMHLLRGRLKSKVGKSTEGNVLSTETYVYTGSINDTTHVSKSIEYVLDRYRIVSNYLCNSQLKSVRTITDGASARTDYEYNSRYQKRMETVFNNDSLAVRTRWYYVPDLYSEARTSAERHMLDSNIVSTPVYEVKSLKRTGASSPEILASATHTVFGEYAAAGRTLFKPSRIEASTSRYEGNIYSSTPPSVTYRTIFTYSSYNRYGRPCHVTDASGIPTVLLWGYGGLYPVARITGVQPAVFNALFHTGGGFETGISGWSGLDSYTENLLRKCPGTAVTTWKYRPFVGMTTVTTPDGRTRTYDYDEFGRLTAVTGPDGNLDTAYDYYTRLRK